jgi:uncharacterized protein
MPDADGTTSHEAPGAPPRPSRRLSGVSVLTLAIVVALALGGAALWVAVDHSTPSGHASAACGPGTPKLTVQGTGQATATPDLLTVVVQVDTTGPSATAALASDNADAGAAVAAFRTGGVESKDIQTADLSLQPQYAYPKGVPTLTGYQVTNSITATLRDISKAGTTIDGVVGVAGNAVQIESIGFSASNPNGVEDQARARATAVAVARAHVLAKAGGRSLGPVCSMSDQSEIANSDGANDAFKDAAPTSAGLAVPIETGTQTQSAQISLVYALEQRGHHAA